ncbi:MAG: N-acetylmuramoyl-L-alanine amidase [Alphaproteobacteria bacterium]|nr:MAG: N-acetylmuramoyl-L-alanine amidase [Alphaproteobacteria bacterium]
MRNLLIRWPVLVGCVMAFVAFAVFVPPLVGNSNDGRDEPGLVEDLRVGKDGERTRIVLQFSEATTEEEFQFRWFTLPEPARVVVDFKDITFKNSPNLVKLPPDGLAKGMRAGRFRPGTVRMVLDQTKAGRVNVFAIPPRGGQGPRLVIDLVELKKGQKPTNVPPPEDVVDEGKAPAVSPRRIEDEPAPVVPPVVTREVGPGPRDRVVVVLDAGHGGVDPGACSKIAKLCEKGLTLEMVKLVRERLRSDKIEVILTRDSDVFIPLPERPRIAQRAGADLFVSLHADIHPTKRDVKGATVYMVSEKASDREAARLASAENDRDVMAGVALANESKEVQNILISLVQRDTLNSSTYLARSVLKELGNFTEVRKHDVLYAGFRVLKSPDVPSILVEMGYLSNPSEERKLGDSGYRKKLADTIAKGIRNYVQNHVHY